MSVSWPANLLDPAYAQTVIEAVTAGNYALEWSPITATGNGRTVKILFSSDALKIDGVRVNVSATLQQQIADALGALLPTPKIMDLAWLGRGATIQPSILPIAATSAAMLQSSAKLDAEIAALNSPQGILLSQKTWAIGNSLLTHPGKAMNYGFFVIPNQANNHYSGIGTEACVSFPLQPQLGRVIQGQGWAHDASHLDYSQCAWFAHRSAVVDGSAEDLAQVLTDPSLAGLFSHEGPLQVLRQPGVAQFACPLPSQPVAVRGATRFNPTAYGLCQAPPAPALEEVRVGTLFASAAVGFAAGFAAMLGAARLRA